MAIRRDGKSLKTPRHQRFKAFALIVGVFEKNFTVNEYLPE